MVGGQLGSTIMGNKFEQAFVNEIDALFEDDRARALATISSELHKFLILEAPGVRFKYSATDDELVAILKVLSRDALVTYAQFHASKPLGFPELPISFDACKEMKNKRYPCAQLTGFFGLSQLMARWDKKHPTFKPFFRGLLADERTPKQLREDPELRKMFSPKPLEGLRQGGYWATPATLKGWVDLVARIDASVRQPANSVLMIAHARALADRGIQY